mmetsp:Transcript_74391/g.138928  ORF Transcript_74391/g.138928 Transcript_74391/m.138928 type:complete len:397 (-) Transcript_74391:192-1382(-)
MLGGPGYAFGGGGFGASGIGGLGTNELGYGMQGPENPGGVTLPTTTQGFGGFVGNDQQTKAAVPRGGHRAGQSLTPLTIRMLLDAHEKQKLQGEGPDAPLIVNDREVYLFTLVGCVETVQEQMQFKLYNINDGTGRIQARIYTDTNHVSGPAAGDYVRVHGSLNAFSGSLQVGAHDIRCVESSNEVAHHFVEVVHVHLMLTGQIRKGSADVKPTMGQPSMPSMPSMQMPSLQQQQQQQQLPPQHMQSFQPGPSGPSPYQQGPPAFQQNQQGFQQGQFQQRPAAPMQQQPPGMSAPDMRQMQPQQSPYGQPPASMQYGQPPPQMQTPQLLGGGRPQAPGAVDPSLGRYPGGNSVQNTAGQFATSPGVSGGFGGQGFAGQGFGGQGFGGPGFGGPGVP